MPLNIPFPPLLAAKIILLGDAPILTILYAALVVRVPDRRTRKEIMPMSRTLAALASLVLTFMGVVFLYPPDCAHACSCMGVSTQRYISGSDTVFSGKVVEIDGPPRIPHAPSSGSDTVTFRVSESWKGPGGGGTLEVKTPASGVSCGYHFEEGKEYLVYAYGKGESLKTSICSGTKPLSKADKDLALLGDGEKSKNGGEALTDTSGVVGARAMVGIAGLAMVASFLVVVRLVRTGQVQ
jgi:hypothetical protein